MSTKITLALLMIATVEAAKWCTTSDAEQVQCESMVTLLNGMAAPVSDITWSCTKTGSVEECITALEGGEADLSVLDAGQLFGFNQNGAQLQPVIAENYGGEFQNSYYSVAVVKASSGITSLEGLRGKRACHTGYRKTAGWMSPVGNLVAKGIMEVIDADAYVANDLESHKAFFGDSCAPGLIGARRCEICSGGCDSNSNYAGYDGALRCLVEDAGEVAFVKHATVASLSDPESYLLLCPDGGTAPVTDFQSCNLASVPAHVVVARTGDSENVAIAAAMETASADQDFKSLMFDSANNSENYVFKSSTVSLDALAPTATVSSFLGTAEALYTGIANLGSPARWCAISQEEMNKCEAMVEVLKEVDPSTAWGCVMHDSHDDCTSALNAGTVELVTLDGHDIFEGEKRHGLRMVVAENYGGERGTSYYAVAVVKANSDITSFSQLEGKRSCHTGYQKSAGWNVPLGTMLAKNIVETVSADASRANDIETIQSFFSESCAPGNDDDSRLCSACSGNCEKDVLTEPYYGYGGAFRCLLEDAGDVAFVKHETVAAYSENGSSAQDWSQNAETGDYRLLCPNGGVKAVDQYEDCYLNRVVAHAVVTGSQMTDERINKFRDTLVAAQNNQDFIALFMEDGSNPGDAIFKHGITALTPVTVSTRGYLAFNYDVFSSLDAMNAVATTSTTPENGNENAAPVNNITNVYGDSAGLVGALCLAVGILFACFFMKCLRMYNGKSSSQKSGVSRFEMGHTQNVATGV